MEGNPSELEKIQKMEQRYTTGTESSKADLKRSIEEAKESLSDTVGNIADELRETIDWRSWVRRYPMGFMVGALVAGYWIGQNFSPSSVSNISSETARKDISQIPNMLGTVLAGLLSQRAREFVEGLGASGTRAQEPMSASSTRTRETAGTSAY